MNSFASFVLFGRIGIIVVLLFGVVLLSVACSGEDNLAEKEKGPEKPVRIVYVDWASEVASSNVVKAVIQERLDRQCELLEVSLRAMWESLAAGDQDGMVAAWLPSLQKRYLEKYGAEVENLGPNLEGTRLGLVVPEYVEIDSIEELEDYRKRFEGRIVGIDPQAGLMEKTGQAMEAYGLDGFELVSGSGPTMTTILGRAIEKERWIVVTGWTPHWMFAKWDLKYLDDPRNVYGDEEHIGTFVRKGLREDMPEVYAFLDHFKWSPEDMEQVMLYARKEDTSNYEAARRWIEENESLVNRWLDQ